MLVDVVERKHLVQTSSGHDCPEKTSGDLPCTTALFNYPVQLLGHFDSLQASLQVSDESLI
jgi:hypothetical protein